MPSLHLTEMLARESALSALNRLDLLIMAISASFLLI